MDNTQGVPSDGQSVLAGGRKLLSAIGHARPKGKARIFRRKFTAVGAPPGTYSAPEDAAETVVQIFSYDAETIEERRARSAPEVREIVEADRGAGRMTWIDVQGLRDVALLEGLRDLLEIHPLAFADMLNVGQRPKMDDYGASLFVAIRMVTVPEGEIRWEQVSVFARMGVILTAQERAGDCLEPLRDRLRKGRKMLRGSGADYLMAMVIDAIVDGYFPVVDHYGERLEVLEEEVVQRPSQALLREVYRAKRELLTFRRAVWPLRDAMSQMMREDEHEMVSDHSRPYLRDTFDHLMQVFDIIETYREMASSFMDIYLSSISNKTNEVMRVLTIGAAIFIPITFIAGVYGMNFEYIPELGFKYGYFVFWALVLGVAGGMLGLFWKLGWIGKK